MFNYSHDEEQNGLLLLYMAGLLGLKVGVIRS